MTAIASGGTNPYIYDWDNGLGSGASHVVSPTVTTLYNVTVTDNNGCQETTSVLVNVNENPQALISGNTTICQGNASTLDAGSGYSAYLWNTNATTQSILVTEAGSYSVTVTDDNGCTGSDVVIVSVSSSLNPVITGDSIICDGQTAILNAGVGFDNYSWSNGATTQTIAVDDAGTYSVTVSNNSGCDGNDDIILVVNDLPNATAG